jgi:nucleotide-binding universal stress UspA family protein
LKRASRVLILTATPPSARACGAPRLQAFLQARDVESEVEVLSVSGEPAAHLIKAAKAADASLLVAGAFGHTRLREFIFGGATRTFLTAECPSLFLSH